MQTVIKRKIKTNLKYRSRENEEEKGEDGWIHGNKHIKPKYNGGTGEIQETEAPIHKSNVKVESTKTEEKKPAKKKAEKTTKKSK